MNSICLVIDRSPIQGVLQNDREPILNRNRGGKAVGAVVRAGSPLITQRQVRAAALKRGLHVPLQGRRSEQGLSRDGGVAECLA
jgi:hypothetical protein